MQKMGKGMFNLKKNDDNTLQTNGLDHRGFHLPHHILVKERCILKTEGNILKRNTDLKNEQQEQIFCLGISCPLKKKY